ncbi:hypothetical protein OG871_30385 [Kitasatospora sp. NBC_00374]|uniref:hypothetical protein n=1 Tax=Kitasatospora sp. NBC_00374 TaxID=2975964 RepID=UPI00324E4605
MRLDGRPYTVLGLRPGTAAGFATNHYHQTWHILSDRHGAQVLARLLWGLSYERHPGTLIVVDRPFLDPTPFEGEASDPIVLVPRDLTPLGERAARALRRALPLGSPPDGTVRWRTTGLDRALADPDGWREAVRGEHRRGGDFRSLVTRRGGLIVVSAAPWELRAWAVESARLGERGPYESDHMFLGDGCFAPGEVQTFRRYRAMVSSAVVARREVLAEDTSGRPPQAVHERIWRRSAAVRRRTAPAPGARGRGRRTGVGQPARRYLVDGTPEG